jgi:hypothetical protein
MGASDGPHLYGTPDAKSQQPPPAGGLRGEGAPLPADDASPELTHTVDAGDRPVLVQEASGSAFVEATGKAGHKNDDEEPGRASTAGDRP